MDLHSVTSPRRRAGLTWPAAGVWAMGARGTPGLTMGDPRLQVQSNGPALMASQQTVGHVLTEMGFGVEADVEGEGRQEGQWQAVHPRRREMSAASCHVVFVARWKTQNRKSGAPSWTSLSNQLWSDSPRQTFSAAFTGLSLTLCLELLHLHPFCFCVYSMLNFVFGVCFQTDVAYSIN